MDFNHLLLFIIYFIAAFYSIKTLSHIYEGRYWRLQLLHTSMFTTSWDHFSIIQTVPQVRYRLNFYAPYSSDEFDEPLSLYILLRRVCISVITDISEHIDKWFQMNTAKLHVVYEHLNLASTTSI